MIPGYAPCHTLDGGRAWTPAAPPTQVAHLRGLPDVPIEPRAPRAPCDFWARKRSGVGFRDRSEGSSRDVAPEGGPAWTCYWPGAKGPYREAMDRYV